MTVQKPPEILLSSRPEMRQNLTTGEWVLMAPERARRPQQFVSPRSQRHNVPRFEPSCPFCPGNETETPPPIAIIPASDDPHRWAVRVVPNKFAALTPNGDIERHRSHDLFPTLTGIGHHEVIIDSPAHNGFLPDLPPAQIALLLRIWRARYCALRHDARMQMISLFKNHGAQAGASLAHPHTQIIATPVISAASRARHTSAQQYYHEHQQCLCCSLLRAELADGRRIVLESASHVVYQPYAARFPFETWIVPRRHQACFGDSTDATLDDLGQLLREYTRRLTSALHDPDYNLVLHTTLQAEAKHYYHWYIELIPRLVQMAGFELGSGMAINPALPEETATFLRHAT